MVTKRKKPPMRLFCIHVPIFVGFYADSA
jgi:hypothetical protein